MWPRDQTLINTHLPLLVCLRQRQHPPQRQLLQPDQITLGKPAVRSRPCYALLLLLLLLLLLHRALSCASLDAFAQISYRLPALLLMQTML